MDIAVLELGKQEEKFRKKGLDTVEALSNFYPRKYYDFRQPVPFDECANKWCSIVGYAGNVVKKEKYVRITVKEDGRDNWVSCYWFGQSYMAAKLSAFKGKKVIVCGRFTENEGFITVVSPLIFSDEIENNQLIYSVYSKIQGVSDEFLKNAIHKALELCPKNEHLDRLMLRDFGIVEKDKFYEMVHRPKSENDIMNARKRIGFEQMYEATYEMVKDSIDHSDLNYHKAGCLDFAKKYIQSLPFDMTPDQKSGLIQIYEVMSGTKRLKGILQGDVGTGKTAVAIACALMMAQVGKQTAIMVPLATLAKQHAKEVKTAAEQLGIGVAFLSNDLKKSERKKELERIADGSALIIVGTHSLYSEDVVYKDLGLCIIDEMHRFGVKQRNDLVNKGNNPHVLSMSATPIPRSMAIMLFGDSVTQIIIKTKPAVRLPIKTCAIKMSEKNRAYNFLLSEVSKGKQAFIVCPFAKEYEKSEDEDEIASVESTYKYLTKNYPNISVDMATGQMDKKKLTSAMDKFVSGQTSVLVATTIIEVGVNVPNSTVIMIESADRFGLAQLHQLRGRVGRGSDQGFCVLLTSDNETDPMLNPRISAMCQTTDGFEIAKLDAMARGSGSLTSTEQSGNNNTMSLIMNNSQYFDVLKRYIKEKIFKVFK